MITKLYKANKDFICSICDRKIPVGHNFWLVMEPSTRITLAKEHTNCEAYSEFHIRNQEIRND